MVSEKTCICCFKGYQKKYIVKIKKQILLMLLSWSSWKSNKDILFEYIPPPKINPMPFTMSFDIYMKWKFDYSLSVLHFQFLLKGLEFQVNQENIHPLLLYWSLSYPLIWKSFFKGELPLNSFTCYFDNFLCILQILLIAK